MLIEAGADLDARGPNEGETALYMASQNAHEEVVKLLVEAGANLNIYDFGGILPLSLSFRLRSWANPDRTACHRRIGFILLRAGASIDRLYIRYYGDNKCLADDFSPEDYKFLENVKNAGGYPAFVEARVEVAVLAELMSRGGKLPDELICVAVEFLGLELPRWKPAPKKQ